MKLSHMLMAATALAIIVDIPAIQAQVVGVVDPDQDHRDLGRLCQGYCQVFFPDLVIWQMPQL